MKRTCILLIIYITSLSSFSQSPFHNIIHSVLTNDKEILSNEKSLASDISFNEVSGPEIEFEHLWPSTSAEDVKWNISISQDIDWPGTYSANSKISSLEKTRSSIILSTIRADKALSTKLLIIDIINSHRRQELYNYVRKNLIFVDSLTEVAFNHGNATALDKWKTNLALLENEHNITAATADIRALEGALAATGAIFESGEDEFWHNYPIQQMPDPSLVDLNPLARQLHSNSLEMGNAKIRATKLQAAPSFSVGYVHAFEDKTHFNGFKVALRLPDFSQNKKNKRALLQAQALELETSFETQRADAEFTSLYNEAKALAVTLKSYQSLTGDDTYIRLLDKAYRAGQLTVIDYLNEVNIFITARLGYLDLEYRYNLALARLNRYLTIDFN